MGSFSTSCMVSGLPIGHGEPVRFVAMSENPFRETKHFTCYIHDQWVPLHVPIKARYNDYGSVEHVEDSENSRSFFRTLSHLAIERPDEGAHKCKVEKGMSDEDWLDALWHQRVQVVRPLHMFARKVDPSLGIEGLFVGDPNSQHSVFKPKVLYENTTNLPILQVSWAMIREDIWQTMLSLSPETPEHRSLGLATYIMHPEDGYTHESELEAAIEYKRIQDAMHNLSRIWTPGHTCGPQFPEYDIQAPFAAAIAAIAESEQEDDYDDSE